MGDLISRQAAIELIHSLYPSAPIMQINRKRWKKKYKSYIEAEKVLEMFPSAEPEIIRCKDCKYYYNNDPENIPTANIICFQMHEEDFCSYAERRTK